MKNLINLAQKNFSGILLCIALAIPSWFLGKTFPIIGGPVFAIIFGITIITVFPKLTVAKINCTDGITYTSKKILQYSIILLGFEMNLYNIIKVGAQSLYIMIFTLAAGFIVVYILGKALKLSSNTTTLIGVGTAICGGSAIAATAPVIKAEDEEIAHSISTIFLFNILAVFIFPALGHLMNMNDTSFGMWAGTAINDTSSVVAAGSSWSNSAGNNTALQFATVVKLTRTLMIVPITIALAIYTTKKQKQSRQSDFNFIKIFPWFIIFFVLAAIINTFSGMPDVFFKNLVTFGKFLIVMAMGAIGLKTNLKSLVFYGYKPIILGLCCWLTIAVVSIIVQNILGI